MNTFFLALSEIVLGFLISILVIYFSLKIYCTLLQVNLSDIYHNNALALLMASFIFSGGFILIDVIRPTLMTSEIIANTSPGALILIFKTILYLLLFISICLALGFFVIFFSFKLFDLLTKGVKEQEEIVKKGNLAVAMVVASVIIVITLLVNPSIRLLIETLVPSPDSFLK